MCNAKSAVIFKNKNRQALSCWQLRKPKQKCRLKGYFPLAESWSYHLASWRRILMNTCRQILP